MTVSTPMEVCDHCGEWTVDCVECHGYCMHCGKFSFLMSHMTKDEDYYWCPSCYRDIVEEF